MQEENEVKQNGGAQQGNIHKDSDEGRNEKGHQGSTLEKTSDRDPELAENDDKKKTNRGTTPSHGGKQEPDTEGQP